MKDLMGLMKQAEGLQKKMQEAQAEIERATIEGAAGGGMVKVTLNGKGDLKALKIDPSLLNQDEGEILEDLIIAAHAEASKKREETKMKSMQALTAGLPLPPGMKLPF